MTTYLGSLLLLMLLMDLEKTAFFVRIERKKKTLSEELFL